MTACIKERKSKEREFDIMATLTDEGWGLLEGARIKNALAFIKTKWASDVISTGNALFIACISTDPVHRMLFGVLEAESAAHGNPQYRQRLRGAQKAAVGASGSFTGAGKGQTIAVELASGRMALKHLKEGARILADPPPHVSSWRYLLAPKESSPDFPDTIMHLWRSLLPGLAQMYFRTVVLWNQWPNRLFLLLDDTVAPDD